MRDMTKGGTTARARASVVNRTSWERSGTGASAAGRRTRREALQTGMFGAVHDEIAGPGIGPEHGGHLAGLGPVRLHVATATHEAETDHDHQHPRLHARIGERGHAPGHDHHEEREHERAVTRLERAA